MTAMPPAVALRGITKRFPGVVANDRVDFTVAAGEIHALLGENGAGKTTLMNILYGLSQPDAGEIVLHGQRVALTSPGVAMVHGIGMVHQHFMLVPTLTVTENVILGHETTCWGPFLSYRRAAQRLRDLAQQYHLDVDSDALVQELPVGLRQRVEILKALYRRATILILDEPTAVLTPQEAEHVFQTVTALAQQGTAIIFITHKLKDALRVAHRVTILRQGRVVDTTTPAATTEARLAMLMVGEEPPTRSTTMSPGVSPEVILHVQDVQVVDARAVTVVDGVSLVVHAGEILGLAGVQGNGQMELVEVVAGLRAARAGTITIAGLDTTRVTPRQLAAQGVAHIPEERQKYGMVESYSIADNLVLTTYDQPPFAHGLRRRAAAIAEHARHLMRTFDLRAPNPATRAGSLSGGNQQKLVVARACAHPRRLLIAAQPTRGLDIAATAFVHQQLLQQRNQGGAVLLVSTDLDELLSLADRMAVMYRGKIVATLAAHETSREAVGRLMAGLADSGRAA
jgi:simple sugar transport system ATP-binding protein